MLTVRREVLYWFDVEPPALNSLSLPEMPVYIWIGTNMSDMIYGFPAVDGARAGIKISMDDYSTTAIPDEPRVSATADEMQRMYDTRVRERVLGVTPRCLRTVTCHYTLTPDYGFIIDRHPEHERVLMVSACSGHGFKHSGGVGECLAEIVTDGKSRIDVAPFQMARFRH